VSWGYLVEMVKITPGGTIFFLHFHAKKSVSASSWKKVVLSMEICAVLRYLYAFHLPKKLIPLEEK